MKREEKNLQSIQKILDSALQEFGCMGYGLSSINTICSKGGISKGVMYHYFKDKDEVYLLCVQRCFELLTTHLRERMENQTGEVEARLEAYFGARMEFFQENPLYQRVFSDAVIYPPVHLSEAIREIAADFHQFNRQLLDELLDQVVLRPNVTREEVRDTFEQYQNFINSGFRAGEEAGVSGREEKCRRAIDILLYGVVAREGEETNAGGNEA